jgi:hypothetical protein
MLSLVSLFVSLEYGAHAPTGAIRGREERSVKIRAIRGKEKN